MAVAQRIRTRSKLEVADREQPILPSTEGELAVRLLAMAREAGRRGVIHVAASEGRAERLVRNLWRLGGGVDAMLFPPWDCLPYDRVSPSPEVMGLRIAALSRLAAGADRPWRPARRRASAGGRRGPSRSA